MPVRMNFGSGSVQPEGWTHVDKEDGYGFVDEVRHGAWRIDGVPTDGFYSIDVRHGFPIQWTGTFDYVVANHSLSDLNHHELPGALSELHRVLRPGGVLRVMVPDLAGAIEAWMDEDGGWFPQGDDLTDLDERFVTFVTWFGTVGSVFTSTYLALLLHRAGFACEYGLRHGLTSCDDEGILELDDDRTTALVMEGLKP